MRPFRQNLSRLFIRGILAVFAAISMFGTVVYADSAEDEINSLIAAVAESGCTFIRNGKEYDAHEAEQHLQLKYRRGRKHAKTAEQFISRLASQSSMSRKPYYMQCAGEPAQPSGDWLTNRLDLLRNGQHAVLGDDYPIVK